MLLSINTKIIDKPVDKKNHGTPFEPFDLSVDELIDHIKAGHAYSAQFKGKKRRSDNYIASGILAVDIDAGMTLQQAIDLPFVQFFASFIHTTYSHKTEQNRFRIVFELEEPIKDAGLYRAAMTGLIQKFGGDKSTSDAARFFYGFRDAKIHRFGKRLPTSEIHAVAALHRMGSPSEDGLTAKHNPSIRAELPFGSDHLVKRADGAVVPLSAITLADRTIHCPFHPDQHPSAFVVWSKSGCIGIHCHACMKTSWAQSGATVADSEWHTHYQRGAEDFTWSWSDDEESALPGPYHAANGTQVWLTDSRYLPEIDIRPGVTYIRSPKGSGKTEQLAKVVEKLRSDGKRILLVGHRRLLLNNLAKRLGIPSYMKSHASDGLDESGCLAVSLESLPNFVKPWKDKFDVIMIDESEQVVSHFTSKTMAKMRLASRALLEYLLQKAEYVICSDADVGLLTSGLIYGMLEKAHPDHLFLNRYRRGQGDSDGATNTISLYDDDGALLDLLRRDVATNKRCFVATNSKKQADRMHALLKGEHPDKEILLITRATSALDKVKRFTKHPAKEFLQYDVVICSPALSTGVDITFPNGLVGVDGVYGFFRDGITTHFEIDQQLARVRNPGKISVWISSNRAYWETDPTVIHSELVRNRDMAEQIVSYSFDGEPRYADDAVLELVAWVLSVRRSSLRDLKNLFIALRSSNGWNVEHVTEISSTKLRGNVASAKRNALICSSPDLDRVGYDMLNAKLKSSRGVCETDLAMIERYELKKAYNVDHVSSELVDLDDEGSFRQIFWNLRLLSLREGGSRFSPGVIQRDFADISKGDQSSVDWSHRTRKKRLLTEVLTAAGLYQDGDGFSFIHAVSKKNLGKFIAVVEANRADLGSLFDLTVRSDLHRAPVLQLKEILKLVGLRLTKMARVRKNHSRTDNYWLDQERWEFVVNTCGLESNFISRQILVEQVEMGVRLSEV